MKKQNVIVTKVVSILELLVGLSAIQGGYGLLTNSSGVPVKLLEGSPFSSFFWPGMILIFIVGGSYLVASVTMWRRSRFFHEASAIAGFGLLIWLFTELYLLQHSFWLQAVYFGLGIGTLVFVMILLKYERAARV